MNNSYRYISNNNLSLAWSEAFLHLMSKGVVAISPLVVSIPVAETPIPEILPIKEKLDSCLQRTTNFKVDTVANTIFPESLWTSSKSRQELFRRFGLIQPRLLTFKQNRKGTYFQRLVAYQTEDGNQPFNQLEHVISTYRGGNHRNSALQASIFDPTRDHNNQPYAGFPCLQHVQFVVDNDQNKKVLTIVGVYATQYIFEKAYGNYLGLYRLGQFMAQEMNLTLKEVVCIVTRAKLGDVNKGELRDLETIVKQYK